MDENSTLYATLLGIIQGTSEFLPISSSGHLVVFSSLVSDKPLPLTLNIALHIGTLSAVLVYFWKDWLRLLKNSLLFVRTGHHTFESKVLLPGLILGSIPAGLIGVLWQDEIEHYLHHPAVVAFPLAIVGLAMWFVDAKAPNKRTLSEITIRDAVLVGVAQAFALIPGVSRSGSTILGGRLLGIQREDAARFSFLLGTPAMAGAALLNASDLLASIGEPVFYVGVLVSMLVGCLSIAFLLRFLRRFGLAVFAAYRCVLAALVLLLQI